MPRRLLLACSELLFAELLGGHLTKLCPEHTVHRVASAREVAEASYDLAIVSLSLGDPEVLAWLRTRTRARVGQKVLFVIADEKEVHLHALLQCDVPGIVHRDDSLEFFGLAVKTVLAGASITSPKVRSLRTKFQADPNHYTKILTPREQSVLSLIAEGQRMAAIGRQLSIKTATVIDHRKNIMAKLGLHTQGDLVAYTIAKGFGSRGGKTPPE